LKDSYFNVTVIIFLSMYGRPLILAEFHVNMVIHMGLHISFPSFRSNSLHAIINIMLYWLFHVLFQFLNFFHFIYLFYIPFYHDTIIRTLLRINYKMTTLQRVFTYLFLLSLVLILFYTSFVLFISWWTPCHIFTGNFPESTWNIYFNKLKQFFFLSN
jgi:hypothetical protein